MWASEVLRTYTNLSTFYTFTILLYAFFWVIPRRLNFICWRFGTLCLFHLHWRVGVKNDWVWETLGYLYGKRFRSIIAWANRKEGDRVALLPISSGYFRANLFPYKYPNISQTQSFFTPTRQWRWNRQSVPKRRHIKFRSRGITQKKAHNIQNMTKVWNQEFPIFPNKEMLVKHNLCTTKTYGISYNFCSSAYTQKSNMASTDHGYDVSLPVSW